MKKFLTNHWKDILIIIAAIFIIINIIAKCGAPRTLISEYAKFGPDIERKNISVNVSSIIDNDTSSSSIFGSIMSGNMMRICIIFAVALIAVCLLSDFANKKSAAKKKK